MAAVGVWLVLCLLLCSLVCWTSSLRWHNISNAAETGALCNDFSTAGYFIRKNASSSDWIIFLESGGGCGSPSSCNERFIDSAVRRRYTRVVNRTEVVVDVERAWNDSPDPLAVTSKLMTSLWRFRGAQVGESWEVEGTDILSTNASDNQQFSTYNHVLVPYCSSDLWTLNTNDFAKAQRSDFQFQFNPTSQVSQFTFRGVAILRGVVSNLFAFHGLRGAATVVFAGSSGGGVGVLNHAHWLKEQLDAHTRGSQLLVMLDSSWFINFHGNLERRASFDNTSSLAESGQILPSCVANRLDPTLCVSAPSILTTLFPSDVPVLAIFSLYDLYFLQDSLLQTKRGAYLDLLGVVTEYGGSMNESLRGTERGFPNISYYVTSCFQHTYLATSTLWGGEGSLFGDAAIGGEVDNNKFVHTIRSGIWDTFHLRASPTLEERVTISDAIHNWMQAARHGGVVRYRDSCSGPHCNPSCPDEIILGVVSPYWGVGGQVVAMVAVVSVSCVCVMAKVVLQVFSLYSGYKQTAYLRGLGQGYKDETPVLPLPYCQDVNAISVACLNLRYTVKATHRSVLQEVGLLSPSPSTPDQAKRKMSIAAAGGCVTMETMEGGNTLRHITRNGSRSVDVSSHRQQGNIPHVATKSLFKKHGRKEIIRGISTYFNPGELVAIMGPSGCGKTTFLDLLAGRKMSGESKGEIFVNSVPMETVRDWYVANTGYVLQLATPYYEELTVRENLTLAAHMRLSSSLSLSGRLERVEQVMMETGLTAVAETRIGCSWGGGLSGGQKRRLCVANQILGMPSLIFLDEPTSGLDASSSLELLTHLNRLAESNRTVILTIHQPRLEIFHMFDKIMLLCQGKVAYHGVPEKAYEVFVRAYQFSSLAHSPLNNLDTANPADVIMDMLSSDRAQAAILCYYQHTQEPQAVEYAIEISTSASDGTGDTRVSGMTKGHRRFNILTQLSALEMRAQKRVTWGHLIYLPLIFIAYSVLLGTVYLQTDSPTSLVTGFGIFSCANGLFMFPIIYAYLSRALEIFTLEYADGVGSPAILVLQTFIRFAALTVCPITSSCLGLYLLAVPYHQYRLHTFTQMAVVMLSLNHVWIALLVLVVCTLPSLAPRISPVLSAITGFVGGFFVPRELMPIWYRWLFYVNPNYYGFSSMIRLLLETINLGCVYDSDIECYPTSPLYVLSYFNFDDINPYLHLVVLLGMTGALLLLSWLALKLRHSNGLSLSVKCQVTDKGRHSPERRCVQQMDRDEEGGGGGSHGAVQRDASFAERGDAPGQFVASLTLESSDDHSHHEDRGPTHQGTSEVAAPRHPSLQGSSLLSRSTHSALLLEGESHEVWRPGYQRSRRSRSRGTLADRQKSILARISTYRSTSGGLDTLGDGVVRRKEKVEEEGDREKRLSQWRRIEEDAMAGVNKNWCTQTVPGGEEEEVGSSRPASACVHHHHHVLNFRDSALFQSATHLSPMHASMPDMLARVGHPHPPHPPCFTRDVGCGFLEAPTGSQTLPRKLHTPMEGEGQTDLKGEENGDPSCDPSCVMVAPRGIMEGDPSCVMVTPRGVTEGDPSCVMVTPRGVTEGDPSCIMATPQGVTESPNPQTAGVIGQPEQGPLGPSGQYQGYVGSPVPSSSAHLHSHLHAKRESFAEMVPIPEEGEPATPQHGRTSPPPHRSVPEGSIPPARKPLSGSTPPAPRLGDPLDENSPPNPPAPRPGDLLGENSTPNPPYPRPSSSSSAGDPLGENLPRPSAGTQPCVETHRGDWPLLQSIRHTQPAVCLVRKDGFSSQSGRYVGQHGLTGAASGTSGGVPSSTTTTTTTQQRNYKPVPIISLHSSPGRQSYWLPRANVGSLLPWQQQQQQPPTSRWGMHEGRFCKQTDV